MGSAVLPKPKMRFLQVLFVTGGIITAAGCLWLAYYLLVGIHTRDTACSGCAWNIYDQPQFTWGIGAVILGLILVLIGFLTRGLLRSQSRGPTVQ